MQVNARSVAAGAKCNMWQPASTAPLSLNLQLAVIDRAGPHALVFACRRSAEGWINADTKRLVDVNPTHWREWKELGSANERLAG